MMGKSCESPSSIIGPLWGESTNNSVNAYVNGYLPSGWTNAKSWWGNLVRVLAALLVLCVVNPPIIQWMHIDGILPKGPYLPCVSMAGRALLAGYHRYVNGFLPSGWINAKSWPENLVSPGSIIGSLCCKSTNNSVNAYVNGFFLPSAWSGWTNAKSWRGNLVRVLAALLVLCGVNPPIIQWMHM